MISAFLFFRSDFGWLLSMNEQDAAAFLNLTVRTLRNYRRQGKLSYQEVKGKTRSVVQYDEADITRLRDDLDRRRALGKKQGKDKITPTSQRVTFGLPQGEHEELATEAKKYGLTTGEYARRLVRENLESRFQTEAAELHAELEKTNKEMRKMRNEFCLAFEVLLEVTGFSSDEAQQWVTENLR